MQMDIHATAESVGKTEHRIEMALRVSVDRAWVQPADRLRAQTQCTLKQFHRAGPYQQTTLRKRNKINIDDTSKSLSRAHHTLDAGNAALSVHIHVAADESAAVRDRKE